MTEAPQSQTDYDTPMRLAEAARLRGLSVSTLRTEARRGRLATWRVAGKDWTSLAETDRMFERCRIPAKEPNSGPDQQGSSKAQSGPQSGSSKTGGNKEALDAALETARKLKEGSPNTSRQNMRRRGADKT